MESIAALTSHVHFFLNIFHAHGSTLHYRDLIVRSRCCKWLVTLKWLGTFSCMHHVSHWW